MLSPKHRYNSAVLAVTHNAKGCLNSECPLTRLLAAEALNKPIVANALQRAYAIFQGKRNSKIIMESLLFCQEPLATLIPKIAMHMKTVKDVPELYAHFFFDPTVFEDLFDNLDYIEYLGEKSSDDYLIKDKVTKQLAMTEGFSYIISYFKGGIMEYTASEYIKRLLAIANKFVAQAQNTGILSKESDKLFKWMQLASKLSISLQALKDNSVDDALQDIKIALEYDERPDSIEVLAPDDVLRG